MSTDNYHKITRADCLSVATADEKARLDILTDINLLKRLAIRWCAKNGYRLGGYAGGDCWDATKNDGTWKNWVVDATLCNPDIPNMLCFVPIEGNIATGKYSIVYGFNLLSLPEQFNQGTVLGIVHADGQRAVDKWCEEHPDLMDRLEKAFQ